MSKKTLTAAEKLKILLEKDKDSLRPKGVKKESDQARIRRELTAIADLLLKMLTSGYSGDLIHKRINQSGIKIKTKDTTLRHLKRLFPIEYEQHLGRSKKQNECL